MKELAAFNFSLAITNVSLFNSNPNTNIMGYSKIQSIPLNTLNYRIHTKNGGVHAQRNWLYLAHTELGTHRVFMHVIFVFGLGRRVWTRIIQYICRSIYKCMCMCVCVYVCVCVCVCVCVLLLVMTKCIFLNMYLSDFTFAERTQFYLTVITYPV